ncbi:protein of unknown function [Rhodovastum atsumiense]|nr:protein of unknown function [Rhodovastum atsumiense]
MLPLYMTFLLGLGGVWLCLIRSSSAVTIVTTPPTKVACTRR